NPYSALVYSAYPSDVRHSIVDGKILMEDKKILTVDEAAIIKEAVEYTQIVRDTVIANGDEVL
ncbi:MAG: amidohydrolase, partial [Gammaproteobacteria bacterium]|nr:amidohydrolase [Gammaproteobacteria bacterium]MBU2414829.1 amidohydrolase [Gammaproteobacteria bacterium]